MILVILTLTKSTLFSRSSTFSEELSVLNQWAFLHQTCIDALFGGRMEFSNKILMTLALFSRQPQHFVISKFD